MKQNQLLFVILILYCIGQYKYAVSCVEVSSVKPITLIKHEHSDMHSDHKESKHRVCSKRQLKEIDFNTDVNDLTEENRVSRSLLGSRRHLKLSDANQVVNYFINGGPLKGHDHFVRSSNCDSNNDESNIVGMTNTDTDSSTNTETSNTNSSDFNVSMPHIPPLYSVQNSAPAFHSFDLYKPIGGKLNSMLYPHSNSLVALPHILPKQSALHSVLHPRLHPYINRLHSIPHTLARAARVPIHSLLRAQSDLHQALLPTLPPSLFNNDKTNIKPISHITHLMGPSYSPMTGATLNSFKDKVPLSNIIHTNFLPHLQPTGYVVKFVPHTKTLPSSPVIGLPQQQLSTSVDNNSNTEKVDYINNE